VDLHALPANPSQRPRVSSTTPSQLEHVSATSAGITAGVAAIAAAASTLVAGVIAAASNDDTNASRRLTPRAASVAAVASTVPAFSPFRPQAPSPADEVSDTASGLFLWTSPAAAVNFRRAVVSRLALAIVDFLVDPRSADRDHRGEHAGKQGTEL